MAYRLLPVSPAIKAHPLWEGSLEQQAFEFGGVQRDQIQDMLTRKGRCSDLTAQERSYMALWQETIK